MTLGRKGFLGYLRALGGSNIVKVVPSNGVASESQHTEKRLKVVCGSNSSLLPDRAWTGENTPYTICQVRVSPSVAVSPNIGGIELAEALSRVIPFASTDDARPVLQTVLFRQKDGKLTLITADGYRLAVMTLPFEDGENEVKVEASELKSLIPALRKAKRVRLGIENGGEELDSKSLILETELVKYHYHGASGEYPSYENLIPTEDSSKAQARFDTKQALKAVQSLSALWFDDSLKNWARPIALTVADGKLTLESKEDQGHAEIEAEANGEGKTAIQAKYLNQAVKACGGIVDVHLGTPQSPILFSVDGYRLVIMPMTVPESKAIAEAEKVAEQAEGQPEGEAVAEAEAVAAQAEKVADQSPKPNRKRRKAEAVA